MNDHYVYLSSAHFSADDINETNPVVRENDLRTEVLILKEQIEKLNKKADATLLYIFFILAATFLFCLF